jgi:hypothetical protein
MQLCERAPFRFGLNPFRSRDDKIRIIALGIARHEFARASRPDGTEQQPCPPHRRGGDPERAGVAVLWIMVFNMVTSLLIGAACCVVIVAASSLSDLVDMLLDAVATVIFGVLAVIAAIFGAIFSLFGF